MMALQHSSVRNPYFGTNNLCHVKVGNFLTDLCYNFLVLVLFIDPYFILKFIIFNALVYNNRQQEKSTKQLIFTVTIQKKKYYRRLFN